MPHDAPQQLDSTASYRAALPMESRVGPYKLLQPLGEGGMGVVYLAEQEEPVRRRVALKVIKPGMDSAHVIARFKAEQQALALMDHPNIARVYDAGMTEDGRPYFVMELVHGVPITKYCDDNKLTPRERLELFVPVCRAVQHAHQKGIIHRDLKPSNVLACLHDAKPAAKVIDFGVAKAMEQPLTESTMYTQLGQVVGTLEYMSPEQAEMSPLGIDTRSDVYSLGVMLYELLTGSTPLQRQRLREASFPDILKRIRDEEPPPPSLRLGDSGDTLPAISQRRRMDPVQLTRTVRGELDWIVMKALEKDRTRRYSTAEGLARDLERYLADEPVEACPPTWRYRLGKVWRRNRVAMLVGSLFLLTVILGLAAALWQTNRALLAEQQAAKDRERVAAAERSLQDERREHAVNRALEAAFGGDTQAAESAINDATRVGADPAQMAVCRGVLYLQHNRRDLAVKEATLANQLAPDSVSALALKGMCEQNYDRYPTLARLREVQPATPSDYFLYGACLALDKPIDAIPYLKKASTVLKLSHAHMARAHALHAFHQLPPFDFEPTIREAVSELTVARRLIGDNPQVDEIAGQVLFAAAMLYEEAGKNAQAAEAWSELKKAAERIDRNPASGQGRFFAWSYYLHRAGQDGSEIDDLDFARKYRKEYPELYALSLYLRNQPADALEHLEQTPWPRDARQDYLHMTLLAEKHDTRPEEAFAYYQKVVAQHANSVMWRVLFMDRLLFLNRRHDAITAAKALLDDPNSEKILGTGNMDAPKFYIGVLTDEQFEKTGDNRRKRCNISYIVGMSRLQRGDRAGAREAFRRAVDTRLFYSFSYNYSRLMLARMDADPDWPRWIPPARKSSGKERP